MRGAFLFIAGIVVGLAVDAAIAQNQSPNHGLVGLNHVGIAVPDLDKALAYYTKTLGFPEAFRTKDDKGQIALIYVQISKNTFVELQPVTPQRPAGISHFGVHVENVKASADMFRQRGAKVGDVRGSATKAMLSDVTDLNGLRMELAELPPDSLHRQAMDRWK